MTISKDRVKPSPVPDSWKLSEIFATGIILGSYLALMTVIFFLLAYETNFFPVRISSFHLKSSIFLYFFPFMQAMNDMNKIMKYIYFWFRNILV